MSQGKCVWRTVMTGGRMSQEKCVWRSVMTRGKNVAGEMCLEESDDPGEECRRGSVSGGE